MSLVGTRPPTVDEWDTSYISVLSRYLTMRQFKNYIFLIQNGIRIYDSVTGILINATTLSFLIGLFEQINRPETDFEKVFEIMMESEQNDDEFTIEQMWTLFSYLLKYDLGYIRYDIDPEHENSIIYTITEEQPWINSVGIAENPLF